MENYLPKCNLNDFIENDELNTQIYGALLTLQNDMPNTYEDAQKHPPPGNILHIFNKIYEICHLIKQQIHPEQYFYDYWNKTRAEHTNYETSIIFSAVYIILSLRPKIDNNLIRCLTKIKTNIDLSHYEIFKPILNSGKIYSNNGTSPADFFFLNPKPTKSKT